MTAANFQACLGVILQSEGGFVIDQGGPTMLGVTQTALSAWLRRPATVDEVKALTPQTVAPLYEADYFNAAHCDQLPVGVDLMVFDEAVNEGVGRAVRHLQEALGVTVDGAFGALTLQAVQAAPVADLIDKLHDTNAAYYASLDARFPQDERGWTARNDRTRLLAKQMAQNNAPVIAPVTIPVVASSPVKASNLESLPLVPAISPPIPVAGAIGLGAAIVAAVAAYTGATMQIDLTPILNPLIQIAGLILMGLAGWLVQRVATFAHVSTQSSLRQDALSIIDNGINFAQAKATAAAANASIAIPSKDAVVADAANYALTQAPKLITQLGLTPQQVANIVISKLPPA